jgi:Sigma-54 interaction domain
MSALLTPTFRATAAMDGPGFPSRAASRCSLLNVSVSFFRVVSSSDIGGLVVYGCELREDGFGIATLNPAFNALIEEIERVAVRSRAPVLLLTGATGVVKSHLARRMYKLKKARHQISGAFVEVNCATLRGDGAAFTLFGHKKDSFIGAAADRASLLRAADGGVPFLDEIGELGADERAMLLKAAAVKRYFPMAADREVVSDFQFVICGWRWRPGVFARTRPPASTCGPTRSPAWPSGPKSSRPTSTTCQTRRCRVAANGSLQRRGQDPLRQLCADGR